MQFKLAFTQRKILKHYYCQEEFCSFCIMHNFLLLFYLQPHHLNILPHKIFLIRNLQPWWHYCTPITKGTNEFNVNEAEVSTRILNNTQTLLSEIAPKLKTKRKKCMLKINYLLPNDLIKLEITFKILFNINGSEKTIL